MHDHKSLWSSTATIKSRDSLLINIECDVLVIGGGISGVLTAKKKHGIVRAMALDIHIQESC